MAGAARDLEVQAALLDAMGCGPEAVVVLHVGGGSRATRSAVSRPGSSSFRTRRAPGW